MVKLGKIQIPKTFYHRCLNENTKKGGISLEKRRSVFLIFVLFLIGSWLAGNMMTFRFNPGGEVGFDFGFTLTWITLIVLFGIPVVIFWKARTKMFFLIFSVALFWLTTPIFYHILTVLYFGLIILGFFFITLAYWKGYINKKISFALYGLFIGAGGALFYFFYRGGNIEPARESTSVILEDYPIGAYLFILLSLFAVGFFLYQKYDIFDLTEYFEEEEESIESEISSTVDRAISDISEGKDIRSTIMKCYEQMCLILESEGVTDKEHMTPREFEKAANKTLNVKTSKISRIREIFELARYSSHELREKDKDEVVADLKALKEELT